MLFLKKSTTLFLHTIRRNIASSFSPLPLCSSLLVFVTFGRAKWRSFSKFGLFQKSTCCLFLYAHRHPGSCGGAGGSSPLPPEPLSKVEGRRRKKEWVGGRKKRGRGLE
jgi:hypothetical protein